MGSPDSGLAHSVVVNASRRVGLLAETGSKTTGHGIDCFALVDKVLRESGAKSAEDFGTLARDADYVWGDSVELDQIQPGDVLQFRNHRVESHVFKKLGNGKWSNPDVDWQTRPHHTAIVISILRDGSVDVVEQNTKPDPHKIFRHNIARLEQGIDTRFPNTGQRIDIQVTGDVYAYRPVAKDKAVPATPRH